MRLRLLRVRKLLGTRERILRRRTAGAAAAALRLSLFLGHQRM
jgi:hypothetical protein